jgi:hypothetical protein
VFKRKKKNSIKKKENIYNNSYNYINIIILVIICDHVAQRHGAHPKAIKLESKWKDSGETMINVFGKAKNTSK